MTEDKNPGRKGDICPACGDDIGLPDDIVLGEVVWCFSCGIELEVVSLEPLRVALFEEEEK